MASLAQIWRHPVKGVGAEALGRVTLTKGRPLPLDRAWAILATGTEDTGTWQKCGNFARGCLAPSLMAITASVAGKVITFRHPDLPDLTLDPEQDGAKLVEWVAQIYDPDRPAPHTLVKAPETGMADAPFASVSILGRASLDALSEKAGHAMDPRRFRGNLWLDDLAPFEELNWVGRTLRIGSVELRVDEPIDRCRATEVDPDTGRSDTNTLQLLRQHWGHINFGVKAVVVAGGEISLDEKVEVL